MHCVFYVFLVFFLTLMWFISSNDYNLNITAVTRFEVFTVVKPCCIVVCWLQVIHH